VSLSIGNRLIQVDNVASGSAIVSYLYDALNRRVKKDKSGLENDVVYLYDGSWACPPLLQRRWMSRRPSVSSL